MKTPLVMLIGGGDMLKYAVENGAGWRADCLGDMGGFSKTWCHMRMAYPQRLPEADAIDAWKMSSGTYKLSIAVVGDGDTEPVVQLGIEGRSNDGWYPLSTLAISR